MQTPEISVVLPTFNGEKYLAAAIQSCLAQTFSSFELIIVDDASTDTSPQILEHFLQSDPRIHVVRHTRNQKLPVALNTGFHAAKGRFFTWNSDDNLFVPETLSVLHSYLIQHPQTDIVFSDYQVIDKDGQLLRQQKMGPASSIFEKNTIGASFLYKRAVHEKLSGFAEDLFLVEDFDFWLRAYMHFSFSHLPLPLLKYRVHDASLTQTKFVAIQHALTNCLVRFSNNHSNLPLSHRLMLFQTMLSASECLPWCRSKKNAWQRVFNGDQRLFLRFIVQQSLNWLRNNLKRHLSYWGR